ncbi:methylated-DNA--[protein]-cysteine S-methyltransferase [Vibrio sp. 10N.261.55.A7]|uniref:methylated-DNA--[protein]-cysteine S-methyltransferase n=1 Tax=Vibrio sp. 10N.261.55.A7 TaxID=1880851 RepID=UPI000C8229D2|nr:methylated-DNA--[protein]-cysteine S-methyltransferase [Vibrio sp. 10N.261.55.A7]PMK02437.1 cysteine methyltransferase [Vibrio sp. 10N.261.55.A7]
MNRYSHYQSPLGQLTLQANEEGLLGLWLPVYTTQPDDLGEKDESFPILKETAVQLDEYFASERTEFQLPLAPQGTDFQQKVWHELCKIPYGESWSYKELAERLGKPTASRAVGMANGKNPISIIVPCHRVIGKNGKLTGYAGGLDAKKTLLKLEGIIM